MLISLERPTTLPNDLAAAVAAVERIVLGKPEAVRLAFVALLAEGHLLIEDLPGVGKTTLAHALATVSGLRFQRIQFTSDLLPSDILGVSIYERESQRFHFHPGPIFTELLLADEINRGSPKTQSALLEAMAERQVTVDGQCHPLPRPFLVIATQNPVDLAGTFPLPDSQLDRFLLCIGMGYPDRSAERRMLEEPDRRQLLAELEPVLSVDRVLELIERVREVHASPALLDYLQDLLAASRRLPELAAGLSPRAGLGLLAAARAHAFLAGRLFVLPEDLQAIFVAAAAHRLVPRGDAAVPRRELARRLLAEVAIDRT